MPCALCAATSQVTLGVGRPLTVGDHVHKHMLSVSWHLTTGSLHAAMRHMLQCCEHASLVISHQPNMSSGLCQQSRHQCSAAWLWQMFVYRVPSAPQGALTGYKLKVTLRGDRALTSESCACALFRQGELQRTSSVATYTLEAAVLMSLRPRP